MQTSIKIEKLSKKFTVFQPYKGALGTLKGIFFPQKIEMPAIKEISFAITHGERVAFIGPNGAGKSTTIKMLTGILHPTSGHVEVLGYTPWKDRLALGYKIGTVFGQRTQLWYHLPPLDTFELLSKIYEIDDKAFKTTLEELIDSFEISSLLRTPVRSLSLGERMRCEIVASLLHKPRILFLDEPTIGLDINAKLMIRALLNKLSKEHGTTLFLTSHDTADIEQVCDRVIILDKGTIVLDSSLKNVKKTYMKKKILNLITDREFLKLNLEGLKILQNAQYHFSCEVNIEITPIDKVIHEALKIANLQDVTIEDPSMEEIIRLLYKTTTHA